MSRDNNNLVKITMILTNEIVSAIWFVNSWYILALNLLHVHGTSHVTIEIFLYKQLYKKIIC